ncbi:MAG: hypothetical protein ACRD1G_07740, partial [Acidimicrobiales bacterium]
ARSWLAKRQLPPFDRPPLRGPDGKWLPRKPTPEQLETIKQRYRRLQLVMPPLDEDGKFIEDHPYPRT